MKHVVITGGCGFIGHHLVSAILSKTDWRITILDALTYASRGMERLMDIGAFSGNRVRVIPINLAYPISEDVRHAVGDVNYIVHLAAEVHVDKSIAGSEKFVMSNVMGTHNLLQFARQCEPEHLLYFSTDEVFGPANVFEKHLEWDSYNSSNPYAATKAAGEEMTLAWANTYGIPITVTHCSNVFGERQNPEAFIPSTIGRVLRGKKVYIHTNAEGESGSRFYIYAADVASAVLFLIQREAARDKFNIAGVQEISNMELASTIAAILNLPLDFELTNSLRPGCDFRYGLSGEKLARFGWEPRYDFYHALAHTVRWYGASPEWLKPRSPAVFGGSK